MQAHPTLRAHPRERLSVRRNDTPARRYTFHGSVFGPSGSGSGQGLLLRERSGELIIVRSEKFTLVDIISGVSVPRLEDALRTIYGAEVYADYRRSQSVLVYSPSRLEDRGTSRAARSQLYEGDLYAYLVEVLPNSDGTVHTGSVSVMVKEDISEFKTALIDQEARRQALERPVEPSMKPVEGRARRLLQELNRRRNNADASDAE